MQLNKTALGLSIGILWGVSVFLATLWIFWRGGGEHLVLLNKFYLGYSVTYLGALVGLVYGFVDGFIGGWILAWLHNRFAGSKSQ